MREKPLRLRWLAQGVQWLLLLCCAVLGVALVLRWQRLQHPTHAQPPPSSMMSDIIALYHEKLPSNDENMLRPVTGKEVVRGDTARKVIALTFDDGPYLEITPQLLAVLKWYRVPATFFLVGVRVDEHPDIVRAEAQAGHLLANHSYHHDRLLHVSPTDFQLEIRSCQQAVERVAGRIPRYFRPPGGKYDAQVAQAADRAGCRVVLWTLSPGDYQRPDPRDITARVLAGLKPGAIILLHDGVQQTVDALPIIIEEARARGYRFVTLDDLLGAEVGRQE